VALTAAAARGLTHFVGRLLELEALQQTLARADTGHGQVVAIVGEAGVGKSCLMYECLHAHHPAQGDYRRGIDCLGQTMRPSRGRSAAGTSARFSCRP
jgi:ABC-type dipeptide/oligopeptide/nickel transport system ATPase subunit